MVGEYSYDGDGKRIKKIVPSTGEITIFVYDASGKMVAEYSTIVEPQATAKISYLTNDHLQSPRIITDQNGAVVSRRDFLPFGEEIQRTNYGNDNVREKFATYERDGEIDLDFAQARMYSATLGRFTGCDPIYISKEHTVNPQRWNLYVYVVNNPMVHTDPDGKKPKRIIDVYIAYETYTKEQIKQLQRDLRKLVNNKKVTINVYGWDQTTADNVAQSLRSKGRTVIFAGHIDGLDAGETGELRSNGKPKTATYSVILNNGALLRADGIYIDTGRNDGSRQIVNSEPIKAENVFIFSCGLHPNAASLFGKRMQEGGTFVYSDGGDDTGLEADITVYFAGWAAALIGNNATAQQAADIIQEVSDSYEAQGVPLQNGDNIVACDSNGSCEQKKHKLKPKK